MGGAVGLPLLALAFFVIFQPIKVLPRLQLAPGFSLTDQDGRPLTSEALRGQIVLYSFTYTGCQAPCESPRGLLRELQAELGNGDLAGAPVRLVTVTIDPERDTPAVLRRFGEQAGADFARWTFATGDPGRVRPLVIDGFDVFFGPRLNGDFDLDTRLWLVDGWGLMRAEYAMYLPPAPRVLRDLRLVAAEARNSQGLARYAYEAAHLFGCYSQ
jgi:protein SCO1/2